MKNCEKCNNEIINNYGSGRFCSAKCARSFSTSTESVKTKMCKCIECNTPLTVNKRANTNKIVCLKCKSKKYIITNITSNLQTLNSIPLHNVHKKQICKYCGELECLDKKVCVHHSILPTLIRYFGFNQNVIGTTDIYEEYYRIKNLMDEEYHINKLSITNMMIKYNYIQNDARNFSKILKSMGIEIRSIGEALQNYILSDTYTPWVGYTQYTSGYHTTWDGSKIYYRSSYELEYAQELDNLKIKYKVENLRLIYWDSQLHKQRIAIPDFYLPESNTIVEIKGEWTYDEQNMRDKFKAYKEYGYNVKLMLEKKEVNI